MNKTLPWIFISFLTLGLISPNNLFADYRPQPITLKANETPKELVDIGITEQLGKSLDQTLQFVDETGKTVTLSDYFISGKPVVLSLVYFGCANLCNFHLNGMVDALKSTKELPGKDFEFVTVSIDEKESVGLALEKKQAYLKSLGKPEAANGWHFLTGKKEVIASLTQIVGFKYRWDEESKQWAHASAAIIVNPDGKISRYLHGVYFEPRTLSLAITEASKFQISKIVDTFVLYCFKYDPKRSAYTMYASNLMKVGGLFVMGILFFILGKFWIRQRYILLKQGES